MPRGCFSALLLCRGTKDVHSPIAAQSPPHTPRTPGRRRNDLAAPMLDLSTATLFFPSENQIAAALQMLPRQASGGPPPATSCLLGIRRSANSRGKDRARSMAPTVDSPAVRGDAYLVDARMSGERRQADNRQVDLQATARDKRAPLLQAQAWARSVLRRLNLKTCSNYPVLKRSFTDIPASSQAGQISDAVHGIEPPSLERAEGGLSAAALLVD